MSSLMVVAAVVIWNPVRLDKRVAARVRCLRREDPAPPPEAATRASGGTLLSGADQIQLLRFRRFVGRDAGWRAEDDVHRPRPGAHVLRAEDDTHRAARASRQRRRAAE